jgi:PKD repeat protein
MRGGTITTTLSFLVLAAVFSCVEDPASQGTARTRSGGTRFESNGFNPCNNSGEPVDLISAFTVSRPDSTSLNYIFINESSGATSYLLDFGDGSTPFRYSTFTTKTHTFAGPGLYVATLFAVRDDGMKCSERKIIIDPFLSGG